MSYPEMNRRSGYVSGHVQASNADTEHVSSRLLSGLEKLGKIIGQTLTIFSGYRDPNYSESVGGYYNDPHSRGVGADVNVGGSPIGNWLRSHGLDPVSLLAKLGLESGDQPGFYQGGTDPSHVQIPGSGADQSIVDYGSGSPSATPTGSGTTFGFSELEQLWISAGGSQAMAPTMAAIALAESGGCRYALAGPKDVRPVKSCTYRQTNGENSVGLWQINVQAHPQYSVQSLFDPNANARAAVSILGGGPPTPWSTYTSGAYRQYLSGGGSSPAGGVERPDIPGNENINFFTDRFHDVTGFFGRTGHMIFGEVTDIVGVLKHLTEAFVRFVSFFINPLNWLRMVEFIIGAWAIGAGIWVFTQGSKEESYATIQNVFNSGAGGNLSGGGKGGGAAEAIAKSPIK